MPPLHQKVLIVVAHQDDDAFIIARIKEHIEKGDEIYFVWVAKSFQDGLDYGNERINEAKKAMNFIGVDSLHYEFLDFPDTETYKYIPQIINKLKEIINSFSPNVIYTQAYEMGNIDHDITNFCTVLAAKELKSSVIIYEFPQYSAYDIPDVLPFEFRKFPSTLKTNCRELNSSEIDFVIEYWKHYRSQDFPFMYYVYFLKEEDNLFDFEYLRVEPNYNYLVKPFTAQAAYERYLPNLVYEDFHNAIKNYLSQRREK